MSARPIATTRSAAGMPTGRLAVWWVIASEIVIFGGLLASYVMHRLAHDAWSAQAAHTNTWIGAFNTLEWTAESPPPHGNWEVLPTVYRGPYEYATPGRDQDYWPQNEPA